MFVSETIYSESVFHLSEIMADDRNLSIGYVSPNVEKLLGFTTEEVLEDIHVLNRLLKPEEEKNGFARMQALKPGQADEWDREYIHQKTGEERWFYVVALCRQIQDEVKYILVMSDRTKDHQSFGCEIGGSDGI